MGTIKLKVDEIKDGDQSKWCVISIVDNKEMADSLKEMYSKMLKEVFHQ